MKINLKYNALKVDEIEKSKGLPIENAIGDTSINNLALFIQKGYVDDEGHDGVSRNVALTKIDEYLQTNDKEMLVIDIMEALIDGGFLSRSLNVEKMREAIQKKTKEASEMLNNM